MNKERIFREIYANELKRDKYFDSLPRDICMFVIENSYTDNLLHERDMLIRLIFGEHSEAVEWFLYEWTPGKEISMIGDVTPTPINTIDEYIDWMKKNEGFK